MEHKRECIFGGTVADIIKILQTLPQDARVEVSDGPEVWISYFPYDNSIVIS